MQQVEMAFVGKISAGMTHEIKNALAIIQESCGLMSDLLTFGQKSPVAHLEKFQKVLATIDDQVRRGVEISTRLNRFAHSMDEPLAMVSMNNLLGEVSFLLQRFAQRKKLALKALAAEQELLLETDPFRLQMVVAHCIELLAEEMQEGGQITLQPQGTGQSVVVQVLVQGEKKPGWAELMGGAWRGKLEALEPVMAELGYHLELSGSPEVEGCNLIIPLVKQ